MKLIAFSSLLIASIGIGTCYGNVIGPNEVILANSSNEMAFRSTDPIRRLQKLDEKAKETAQKICKQRVGEEGPLLRSYKLKEVTIEEVNERNFKALTFVGDQLRELDFQFRVGWYYVDEKEISTFESIQLSNDVLHAAFICSTVIQCARRTHENPNWWIHIGNNYEDDVIRSMAIYSAYSYDRLLSLSIYRLKDFNYRAFFRKKLTDSEIDERIRNNQDLYLVNDRLFGMFPKWNNSFYPHRVFEEINCKEEES
jgi:hypothetical protein